MIHSTLCYIEKNNQYLMLHRTLKKNDANHDKWIGVGGHIEPDETPLACILRETLEETGLTLLDAKYRGLVHFRSDQWEDEEMHLFTATEFSGEIMPCDEGELEWIDKSRLLELTLWEGDKVFLKLLDSSESFFDLTLQYQGERLATAFLNGQKLLLNGNQEVKN